MHKFDFFFRVQLIELCYCENNNVLTNYLGNFRSF